MQKLKTNSNGPQTASGSDDPRWRALNAVRAARAPLGIKDRTVAVLKGLLSLVSVETWTGAPMVHASNSTLQERCDGMDERTLRRHLATLVKVGLISRRQSPNRKRYVIRSAAGIPVLTYGFDLTPLRESVPGLLALAEKHRSEMAQVRALKAILRDCLFRLERTCTDGLTSDLHEYRLLLRRNCSVASLDAVITKLQPHLPNLEDPHQTTSLTDGAGQNDRHIQNSKEEYTERESTQRASSNEPGQTFEEMSAAECRDRVPNALAFAWKKPESWHDLIALANQLAPSLGISQDALEKAHKLLGIKGRTLAILGLTQAYPQIKRPDRYLEALLAKATSKILNIKLMFQSLTSTQRQGRFPAGNLV